MAWSALIVPLWSRGLVAPVLVLPPCRRLEHNGTEFPSDSAESSFTVADCAGVGKFPPYYLFYVASVVKVLTTLLLFGPPKPRPDPPPDAGWPTFIATLLEFGKSVLQCAFIALSFWTLRADAVDIYEMASRAPGVWAAARCAAVIIVSSHNFSTTCTLRAVNRLYVSAHVWREAHSPGFVPAGPPPRWQVFWRSAKFDLFLTPELLATRGAFYVVQHITLTCVYFVLPCALITFGRAALVIYAWVLFPLFLILLKVSRCSLTVWSPCLGVLDYRSDSFMMWIMGLRGGSHAPPTDSASESLDDSSSSDGGIQDMEAEPARRAALAALSTLGIGAAGDTYVKLRGFISNPTMVAAENTSDVDKDYEHEMRSFRQTGVPASAWGDYMALSLQNPILNQICLFTMLRLVSGVGYFNAVLLTLFERRTSDYVAYVTGNSLQGHLTLVDSILR